MSQQDTGDELYALPLTEEEERRLQRQAVMYGPATRELFAAAGLGPGMKILDIGSGTGDVAMLAADLVGPTGRVVGVDLNPTILETARRRSHTAGYANLSFIAGDVREVPLDHDFDAVVGRLILCHLREPAAVLRRLLPHMRPGGVAAFYDLDLTVGPASDPPCPLHQQAMGWVKQALVAAGIGGETGTRLHRTFLDAGLAAPHIRVDALMGGSPGFVTDFTWFASETIRAVLPVLVRGGYATEDEVGIDTLADRWRDDVLARGSVIRSYLFMGAWAHKA